MIYRAAKTSPAIRIVTAIVLAMGVGFSVGGLYVKGLLVGGAAIAIVAFCCYLLAPVAYDVTGGCLTVLFRAGKKSFGPITSCTLINERPPLTIRLCGNGGLFAGTGLFWNAQYGKFRAYVTRASFQDGVLVETERGKVVITPENPQVFAASAGPRGQMDQQRDA